MYISYKTKYTFSKKIPTLLKDISDISISISARGRVEIKENVMISVSP